MDDDGAISEALPGFRCCECSALGAVLVVAIQIAVEAPALAAAFTAKVGSIDIGHGSLLSAVPLRLFPQGILHDVKQRRLRARRAVTSSPLYLHGCFEAAIPCLRRYTVLIRTGIVADLIGLEANPEWNEHDV